MIISRPSSIQHLVTIQEKIENETISRNEVKKSYNDLPFTVQHIIRQTIELITHQTISLDEAEKFIQSEDGVGGVAHDCFHRELHKVNRVFHLAITWIIKEFTATRIYKPQLETLQKKIREKESNRAIQTFYERTLLPEMQGMIAGAMYNRYQYAKIFTTNDAAIRWMLSIFNQLPEEGLIVHPQSPFRSVVDELLQLYNQET
ncbi:MAG: hypothetical protein Q8L98_03645 [Chlamydiales bacterium]|nr:hypothetical protein [Chlamydiales bacterium]